MKFFSACRSSSRAARRADHQYSAMPSTSTPSTNTEQVQAIEAVDIAALASNQIVALNRGARDGLERGHVLALWRAGAAGTASGACRAEVGMVRLPRGKLRGH